MAEGFGVVERCDGIGRLARLRNGDDERVRIGYRVAIAVLARNFDGTGDLGHRLEPVPGDHTGMKARAAGKDQYALHVAENAFRLDSE